MYGILISLGILLALLHTEVLTKREDLDTDVLWAGSFWVIIFGLIGARLYHVFEFWHIYSKNIVSSIWIWRGGMGIIGGLVLGGVTLIIFLRRKKQPVFRWLDLITINIPLAQAIGRWGNVFNRELIPYAVYESALDIVLFLFLYVLNTKRKIKPGTIFFGYLVGYSLIRFSLESIKTNPWVIGQVSIVRVISILILILSVVCYSLIVRKDYDLSSS